MSELVYRFLVGNKSAKPGEVWRNKCNLGRTKRLLWHFNKRHSNKGQMEKQMCFLLSFSHFTLSTVLWSSENELVSVFFIFRVWYCHWEFILKGGRGRGISIKKGFNCSKRRLFYFFTVYSEYFMPVLWHCKVCFTILFGTKRLSERPTAFLCIVLEWKLALPPRAGVRSASMDLQLMYRLHSW